MTSSQKIKALILSKLDQPPKFNESNIDEVFKLNDETFDIANDVREGECETGLSCRYSRHYESKAVAGQMLDGSWVGWTYFYGGGHHGNPDEMPWIDDAYDLERLEDKIIAVKQFKAKEG